MRKATMLAAAVGLGAMTAAERSTGRYMRAPDGHGDDNAGATTLEPEQIAAKLQGSIDEKFKKFSDLATNALEESRKNGELSQATKDSVDKLMTELGGLREALADVEQKMARRPGADDGQAKSFGQQFVESEGFKAFAAGGFQGKARHAFDVKEITAAQAGTAWSQRDPEVVGMPRRRMTIRDLLNTVPTTSGSIDYARQVTRTNNAAPVAEGATKPTSAYVWEQVSTPVRTIAHLAKVTRQALEDAVQLQGEIEQEMRYGLAFAEEDQILNGDGTGQNLDGLIANATAYAAPSGAPTADQELDQLRLAMLQIELALYMVDGIVMNPTDWTRAELLKDTTGRYIIGDPQGQIGPRLWGRPVVSTPAMAVDKFLVGAFKAQTLYDRMAPEVQIASENVDDFEKNLYTMRCEERLALAVKRPGALVYGDLGNVA